MKLDVLLVSLFILVIISLTTQSYAYQTSLEKGMFIFVQTTVRNFDGQLVAYLESSKFTHIDLNEIEPFLDFEASRGNDPIVTIEEDEYQVIRRVQTKTFDSNDLVASTLLSNAKDGKIILLARFAHDGYPVSPGDTLESTWTFIRPAS